MKDLESIIQKFKTTYVRNYRKLPVVIRAVRNDDDTPIKIDTLEGVMTANKGDWIIEGVNGEVYPCKDDIFRKTYGPITVER